MKSSISDIDAQIEKLLERKRNLIVKSAERFSRAATKSGLAEMDIGDDELDQIFKEIAAQFRQDAKKGNTDAGAQTHRSADSGSRAEAQRTYDS
ncbi:TraC family protein [Rhizobium sp. BR 362]|uniref:TraC family protein n=1 Tax=Rhizobium sp. BR 362 TaxID=3040670 RepID=UPI002F409A31